MLKLVTFLIGYITLYKCPSDRDYNTKIIQIDHNTVSLSKKPNCANIIVVASVQDGDLL